MGGYLGATPVVAQIDGYNKKQMDALLAQKLALSGGALTGGLSLAGLLDTGPNGQIKFPAAQNASADPNTLDDYEEGTFTIYLADAASGGNAYPIGANYVKIGNLVNIRFSAYVTSTPTWTSSNVILLRNLPFPTSQEGCAGQLMLNTTRGNVPIHAWQPHGNTFFNLQGNVFGDYIVGNQMGSNTTTYANLTYFTS